MLTYTLRQEWKKERKKDDNLLADRTSRQEVDLERKSKRVETCNIVHVSSPISTTEWTKHGRMTKFTTLIIKIVQRVSKKKERREKKNKRTVVVPENSKWRNWKRESKKETGEKFMRVHTLYSAFTCAIRHLSYSFVFLSMSSFVLCLFMSAITA